MKIMLCRQSHDLATASRAERAEAKYQEASVLETLQKRKDAVASYK